MSENLSQKPSRKIVDCEDSQNLVPLRRTYDRRENSRRYFQTPVRFMTEDGGEYEGVLEDISLAGLRISTKTPPDLKSRIILYIDRIGRFEGETVRSNSFEFAIRMMMSDAKLKRLEQSINSFFQEQLPDAMVSDRRGNESDRRNHPRRVVDVDELYGETVDGVRFKCSIANLSLGGAEIITESDLKSGQEVIIGNVKGRVTRKTCNGYAVMRVE